MTAALAFAVPGDITTLTGGYIYDRRLMDGLRALGHDVHHIELPDGFPNPTTHDTQTALAQLAAVPADQPIIIDGLAFGAFATSALHQLTSRLIALIHHPLAKETGLSANRQLQLLQTERDNLALARHVLVPSPHTAEILMSEYNVAAEKITIIRPGTDRPTQAPAPVDPPLILSVGIQAPRKGHDVLLTALADITDLDWQAVIVGAAYDPAYAASLTTLREALGLETRVKIAGQVSTQDLSALYAQATLFALATRFEGYGIVFDEALSNGLPIVSCATGAVLQTVPQDAGVLVPPDDAIQFASALRALLTNPDKRQRLATSARAAGQRLPAWADAAQLASRAILRAGTTV